LSALLLSATDEGLATAPLSDAIKVEWPRLLLRELLGGVGEPFLVIEFECMATPPASQAA
jgi:hypothetical protein